MASEPRTEAFSCVGLEGWRGGAPLYSHVSFSLLEGAVLVVRGANGVGKTTVLRQLAGLETPTQGHIRWLGTAVRDCRDYNGEVLYLSDVNALYPSLSVREQLHYFACGWGEAARLDATIRYLRLEALLELRVSELSAGWQRRVALSRLLLIPALLWVLDEPGVHLDGEGLGLLAGMIRSHSERGGVCILSAPLGDSVRLPLIEGTALSVLDLEDFAENCISPEVEPNPEAATPSPAQASL